MSTSGLADVGSANAGAITGFPIVGNNGARIGTTNADIGSVETIKARLRLERRVGDRVAGTRR
jgi:hypothetical protein